MVPIKRRISAYNSSSGNDITYLVMHFTGNYTDKASGNANYFSEKRDGSAHYFVDDNEIYQVVEDHRAAWHCGDGYNKYGVGNHNSLSIEMCATKGSISKKTRQNAVELATMLCKKYGIPMSRVVRHYDASRKICPEPYAPNKWREWWAFKLAVSEVSGLYWDKDMYTVGQGSAGKYTGSSEMDPNYKPTIPEESFDDKDGLVEFGERGDAVKEVQLLLRKHGYNIAADGIYGTGTGDAIKDFQRKRGLTADGIVGPATLAMLKSSISDTDDSLNGQLLKVGSRGSNVLKAQTNLAYLGYSIGSYGADGIFGESTKTAVIKFQKDNGLSADGIIGNATWNELIVDINPLPLIQVGSKGVTVKALQRALIARGYSVGSYGADGSFGNGSKNAVIKFQKDHSLSADGIVGRNTWDALL